MKMLSGFSEGKKVPYSLGHFFMAIDISAFTDPDDFKNTTGNILRELRASRKMPGQERIYTAGEKEHETWMSRKDKGVPGKELLNEFRGLCIEYDLEQYIEEF